MAVKSVLLIYSWDKQQSALKLLRGHLPDTAACLARLLLRLASVTKWSVPKQELLNEADALISEDETYLRAEWHLVSSNLEQAESLADDTVEGLLLLGRCALARGQAKRAIEHYFDRILEMKENNDFPLDAVYYWLATAYLALNDLVLAGETCWLLQSMQSETGITELKPTPLEIDTLRSQIQERRSANPVKPRSNSERAWLDYALALCQAGRWSDCLASLGKCQQPRSTIYRLEGECRWRLGAPREEVCEWLRRSWEESHNLQVALLLVELGGCNESIAKWLLDENHLVAGWSALAAHDPSAREACLAQLAQEKVDKLAVEAPELKRIRGKDYWEGRSVTKTLKGMLGGDFAMRVRTKKKQKKPKTQHIEVEEEEEEEEVEMNDDVVLHDTSFETEVTLHTGQVVKVIGKAQVRDAVEAAYAAAMPPFECLEVRSGDHLLLPLDPVPLMMQVTMRKDILTTRYQANCRQHGVTPNPHVMERMQLYGDDRLDLSIMELHADDYYLIDLPGVIELDLSCVRGLDCTNLERLLERAPQLQRLRVNFNPLLNVSGACMSLVLM